MTKSEETTNADEPSSKATRKLSILFLLSGVAALLYQLIWQRELFLIYGTNSESITTIVTVFVLGLGCGSLVGGALSTRFGASTLSLFAAAEVGIGLFGAVSPFLIDALIAYTAGSSLFVGALFSFGFFLFPTLLMGATLPLLVHFLTLKNPNIGSIVGELYYVNTLGAALGCILAIIFVFELFGLFGATLFAASLNLTVAGLALSLRGDFENQTKPAMEEN